MIPMNEQFVNMLKGMFPLTPLVAHGGQFNPQNIFPANEQITNLFKANLEAQISAATSVTGTAVESLQKLVELNLNAARASLEDSTAITKQLMTAKDMQEFMSLSVSQAQPTLAKAMSYGRHLAEIATAAQDSLSRATTEQMAETKSRMHEIVDDAAKHTPTGSNNVMDMMQMAINTANANYQRLNRTAQQAAEQAQANMNTALNQFVQAASQTSGTASRAGK